MQLLDSALLNTLDKAFLQQKVDGSPHVLVLRDQDTVEDLSKRLQTAKRVVLVGNGGIALELAYFLEGVEVHFCFSCFIVHFCFSCIMKSSPLRQSATPKAYQ